MTIKSIIEENNSIFGYCFDLAVQSLILISLISFSIETLPDLPPQTQHLFNWIELVTVILFTIEYILRFLVSDKKTQFVFSFFGIVDLLAIVPFYLSLGLDFRSIRAIRFLRMFRIFKLARYNKVMQRFHSAFIIAREELVLFFFTTLLLLYFAAAGIYFFENEAQPETFQSIFHSLWWAVSTLTTVGYGDIYPVTIGGKIFTFFILMLGLGVVSIPSGMIASALTQARELENKNSMKDDVYK